MSEIEQLFYVIGLLITLATGLVIAVTKLEKELADERRDRDQRASSNPEVLTEDEARTRENESDNAWRSERQDHQED